MIHFRSRLDSVQCSLEFRSPAVAAAVDSVAVAVAAVDTWAVVVDWCLRAGDSSPIVSGGAAGAASVAILIDID